MPKEFLRYHTTNIHDILKVDKFRSASGFRDDTKMIFYNHHEAHALLVTADAGGDTVNYNHRHFANGTLNTLYGGDEWFLTPLPLDSNAYAYMTMTDALGFIPLRHEGKLTGLAAYGQPILADSSMPASLAPSMSDGWDTGRARWAHARSWLTHRGGRPMIFSTSACRDPN